MKERISLAILYLLSFILVLVLTVAMIPIIISAPILGISIFSIINDTIVNPLFTTFTPIGGILLLAIVIEATLMLIIKSRNSRAAACFLPGVGAVCAVMEYSRKERDEFIDFYTMQGLVLFAISILVFWASYILIISGGIIGATIGYYTLSLLFIVGGLLLIYMMYEAEKGEKVELFQTQ